MKSKNLKKTALNKRSISSLTVAEVTGGKMKEVDTTFQSSYCANTRDDHSCQCTIA